MSDCIQWLLDDSDRRVTWGQLSVALTGEDLCEEAISVMTMNVEIGNRICDRIQRGWVLERITRRGADFKRTGFAELTIMFTA